MKLIVKADRVIDGTGASADGRDGVLIENGRISAVDRFGALGSTAGTTAPRGSQLSRFASIFAVEPSCRKWFPA